MASPSISMATAAATTTSSVRLSHRMFNLSFDYYPLTLKPKCLKSKPKFLKLEIPNTHLSIFSNSFHCHGSTSSSSFAIKDYNSELDEEFEDDEEFEEELVEEQSEGCRLYVGNLPYSMTSTQLTEIFNEAGRVSSVEIVYDRVTDRSRGFAFVTMGSGEEAREAIRMFEGSQVGGRTVKVNFPEVPRGGEREVMGPKIRGSYRGFVDSPYKIYAGNLGWNLTSEGLKDTFADRPGLLGAKVIYDRNSGKARGFGFVTFSSAEDAQAAIDALNGVEVEGRPLRLNLAAEKANNFTSRPARQTEDFHENAVEASTSL